MSVVARPEEDVVTCWRAEHTLALGCGHTGTNRFGRGIQIDTANFVTVAVVDVGSNHVGCVVHTRGLGAVGLCPGCVAIGIASLGVGERIQAARASLDGPLVSVPLRRPRKPAWGMVLPWEMVIPLDTIIGWQLPLTVSEISLIGEAQVWSR